MNYKKHSNCPTAKGTILILLPASNVLFIFFFMNSILKIK